MYAQITLIGNVGQDPEARFTPAGIPVCNFSVAVNRTWKDESGEQHQQTTWYRVTAWRRQAEICHEHLKKGDRVLIVSDSIEANAWIDQSGTAKGNIEIVARSIKFLTPRANGNELDGDGTPFD